MLIYCFFTDISPQYLTPIMYGAIIIVGSLTSFKKQRCLRVVNKVDYTVNKNRQKIKTDKNQKMNFY